MEFSITTTPLEEYFRGLRPVDYTDVVKLRKQRKPNRPRKTGVVGPELDWEVIYSHVPFKALQRYFVAHQFSNLSRMFPRNGVYHSPKGCIHTSGMRRAHIAAWTRFCYANKIEYSGTNGYLFPKEVVVDYPAKPFYRVRSSHKKGRHVGSKNPSDPPVRWEKLSSKRVRSEWYHRKEKTPFKEFMSTVKNRQYYAIKGVPGPLPGPVLEALTSIYSRKQILVKDTVVVPRYKPGLVPKKDKMDAKRIKREAYEKSLDDRRKTIDWLLAKLATVEHNVRRFNNINDAVTVQTNLILDLVELNRGCFPELRWKEEVITSLYGA
jgi:hypothetical protein